MKKILAALFLLLPVLAQAQTVQQSGSVTPNFAARWVTNGVIGSAGSATAGLLSSIGTANNGGPAICNRSATSGAYNLICLKSSGTAGIISLDNIGGATGGFQLQLNGVTQGLATVQLPVTTGDLSCFTGTTGVLSDCGFPPSGLPLVIGSTVISGGTNNYILFNSSGKLGNEQFIALSQGGLAGSQAAATANQIPVYPGSGGAAVPTTITPAIISSLFANPTASVCTSAVNGSASTAMRSDAAPAYNLACSPTMTGNWTFSPSSGTPLTINSVPASNSQGYSIVMSGPISGTVAGPVNLNLVSVNGYNAATTGTKFADFGAWSSSVVAQRSNFTVGGSNITSATEPFMAFLGHIRVTTATSASNDYEGATGISYANVSVGAGTMEGVVGAIVMDNGGSSSSQIAGVFAEADILTGGSAVQRYGVFIDSEGFITASGDDAAIGVAAIRDAAAFKNLILIRASPAKPLQTTGSLITSDGSYTIANAFDLSQATITGNILATPNLLINGAAVATFGSAANSTGQVVLGPIGNSTTTGTSVTITNSQGVTTPGAGTVLAFLANEASRTTVRYGITIGDWAEIFAGNSNNNGLIIGTNLNVPMVLGTNNIERARITGGGLFNVGPGVAPNYLFTVNANTVAPNTASSNAPIVQFQGADATNPTIVIDGYGTGHLGYMVFRAARGTAASPTAIQSGDLLGFIGAVGANGAGTFANVDGSQGGAFFGIVASETWSGTASGSELRFYTTPNTTRSVAIAGRFQNSGGLTIGAVTTDPGIGGLYINAQTFAPNITTSSAAQTGTVCWTTGTGKFTVDTTVGCLTSLAKAKHIDSDLSPRYALNIVERLQPISFHYRNGWGDSGRYEQFGFTADQAATIDERLVGRDPNGELQGFRYQEYGAVLTAAMQALKADNDNIHAELNKLQRKVTR